jgi:hypothetical protein
MLSIFRPIVERLKALFAATAAQELEAEMLRRDAERRAELLRQAQGYEQEGLHAVARKLRGQAEELGVERPLASALPAAKFLFEMGGGEKAETPALAGGNNPSPEALPEPKKRRSK